MGYNDFMAHLQDEIEDTIRKLSTEMDADLVLLADSLFDDRVDGCMRAIEEIANKKTNIGLILITYGGSPDTAFRFVRFLKRNYKKITLFVFSYCKSAGTLIALGSDEIVMANFGELGPIDVQVRKTDKATKTESGLSYFQAINTLTTLSNSFFKESFDQITSAVRGELTNIEVAQIAEKLTAELFSPITSKLDPLRLGEVDRAANIAAAYGERLCNNADAVRRLTGDYPSHEFVIDIDEARTLFDNNKVRPPTPDEAKLEKFVLGRIREPNGIRIVLTDIIKKSDNEN